MLEVERRRSAVDNGQMMLPPSAQYLRELDGREGRSHKTASPLADCPWRGFREQQK